MDILEQIIEHLSSDEVRRFKILSNRFKADEEKKLIVLFDAIRAGNYDSVEDEIVTQLYGDLSANSKNNYYRLRNKLLSNIEKSLIFYHFNYKNSIEAQNNLQLAILLGEKSLYKESHHYLKKAEKIAINNDQFNLLEVIYDEMVSLGMKDVEIDIEFILKKRKENWTKLEINRKSDEVLCLLTQQLKKRNFSRNKKSDSVIELLEETQQRLESHRHIFQSSVGKIKIYRTVSAILLQKGAFGELEQYIEKTLTEFDANKLLNKDNHNIRLMMHIWRINCLRKLLRIREENEQIEILGKELNMYSKQYYNEFAAYYYSAKINNQKLRGDLDGAGESLKEIFNQKEILSVNMNELSFLISLADQYFCQNLFIHAADTIAKIKLHKKYPKLDEELRYYLCILEIVVAFEAKNYGQVGALHDALKSGYKPFFKSDLYEKAQRFLEIVMRMNQAVIDGKRMFLKTAYKSFSEDFPPSEVSDNQIIMYELYLKAKVEEKTYYPILCEYILGMSKK